MWLVIRTPRPWPSANQPLLPPTEIQILIPFVNLPSKPNEKLVKNEGRHYIFSPVISCCANCCNSTVVKSFKVRLVRSPSLTFYTLLKDNRSICTNLKDMRRNLLSSKKRGNYVFPIKLLARLPELADIELEGTHLLSSSDSFGSVTYWLLPNQL